MRRSRERAYVIGIDGGGTRSRGLAVNMNGEVWAAAEGEALNFNTLSDRSFYTAWHELVRRLRRAVGPGRTLDYTVIGTASLADFPQEDDERRLWGGRRPTPNVAFVGDALMALKGATGGGPGLLVVAGTGSVAVRLDAKRRFRLSGGLGPLVRGDPGSAFWMGSEALAAAALEAAAHTRPTPFTRAVCHALGVARIEQVPTTIYDVEDGVRRVAALAGKLAASPWARRAPFENIQRRAGKELAELVWPLWPKGYGGGELYVAGSVLERNTRVRTALQKRLSELVGQPVSVKHPRLDAVRGAVLWAWEALGVSVEEVMIRKLAEQEI